MCAAGQSPSARGVVCSALHPLRGCPRRTPRTAPTHPTQIWTVQDLSAIEHRDPVVMGTVSLMNRGIRESAVVAQCSWASRGYPLGRRCGGDLSVLRQSGRAAHCKDNRANHEESEQPALHSALELVCDDCEYRGSQEKKNAHTRTIRRKSSAERGQSILDEMQVRAVVSARPRQDRQPIRRPSIVQLRAGPKSPASSMAGDGAPHPAPGLHLLERFDLSSELTGPLAIK